MVEVRVAQKADLWAPSMAVMMVAWTDYLSVVVSVLAKADS